MVVDLALIERNAAMSAVTVKETDGLATGTYWFFDQALSTFRTE
jgi:hypothetical protein